MTASMGPSIKTRTKAGVESSGSVMRLVIKVN